MNKIRKIILIMLILIIICFIWSNSLQNPSESYNRSSEFLAHADKILSYFLGSESRFLIFFRSHVRKIAHFIEYGMLGTASGTFMVMMNKLKPSHFYYALSGSVIAAVIDEYIQLYTYRGSSVKDVLIDFSGFTAGIIFVMSLMAAVKFIRYLFKNKDDRMHS